MAKIHKRVQIIERLNIYGPIDESEKWLRKLYADGYRVIRSGPKVISWPKVDIKRFHFIAEREASPSHPFDLTAKKSGKSA